MQQEVAEDGARAPAGARARRVLVVDDSPLLRRVLSSYLSVWGYHVQAAASGAEALEFCRRAPPELVISDWMMPGMDGLAFCRAFRALERDDYGYFLLLTSKAEKDHVAQGLDSGADDFLTKPVNPAELKARLTAGERILDMQRQLREKNEQLIEALGQLQAIHDSIDSDLVEARKLQQSLVRERFRDFGRAQVALTLTPAGRVGGDLVGFFPAGAKRIGLFSIDVSGHGISSALMTARLAAHLSSVMPERNIALCWEGGEIAPCPPAEVAARLNRLMQEEMAVEHYFTLFLAICDLASGEVRAVQAGHPHPLIQRADGRIESVGTGGLPVGLIPGASYDELRLRLDPGDRLLIMSDGMIECPLSGGGMVGEEGLRGMLSALDRVRGPALLEALLWQLREGNPGPEFPDDISAVVLEYAG